MGGLLTHLSVATFGLLVGIFAFKNYRYGLAFFIGHLTPDLIDFGITGLFHWEFNPAKIMTYSWFAPLAKLGHTWWHWLVFALVFLIVLFILHKFKKISDKRFKLVFILFILFLVAVGIHLGIDHLIMEKSYWI